MRDGEYAPLHRALPPLPHLPQPVKTMKGPLSPPQCTSANTLDALIRFSSLTRHSSSAGSPSSHCQTPCSPAAGACCSRPACSASPAQTHRHRLNTLEVDRNATERHAAHTHTETHHCLIQKHQRKGVSSPDQRQSANRKKQI